MIHQNVIKRRADEDGLPAPAVERDYVLAHALTAISGRDGVGFLELEDYLSTMSEP